MNLRTRQSNTLNQKNKNEVRIFPFRNGLEGNPNLVLISVAVHAQQIKKEPVSEETDSPFFERMKICVNPIYQDGSVRLFEFSRNSRFCSSSSIRSADALTFFSLKPFIWKISVYPARLWMALCAVSALRHSELLRDHRVPSALWQTILRCLLLSSSL